MISSSQNLKYYQLQVLKESAGMRIDKFISLQLPDYSRSKIKKMIENNLLIIDGVTITDCDHQVKGGEEIVIYLLKSEPTKLKPWYQPVEIIFEDEYLAIVNKPAGLTVHPGAGNQDNTLVNALIALYGNQLSKGGDNLRPGIVHRLDKDTSGLLLIAKDDITHAKLSAQLADRQIKRTYQALVYGVLPQKYGTIETLISRNHKDRLKMMVSSHLGRNAITHYQVLKEFKNAVSLVELQLQTGRTHQIRVHMLHLKHPIVGDQVYGTHLNFNLNCLSPAALIAIRNLKRQALHACKLEFIHPITREAHCFISPLPECMSEIIALLT